MSAPRIVTIGGGTGQYVLLSALRELDARITAIVTMMDSGGSSGRLRDEYGTLPPGDFTRCLIALSSHPEALKDLFGHRFGSGSLAGHTLRNLIFAALQEITGDPAETAERMHAVFAVEHRVLPVTLEPVDLVMHLTSGTVLRGEASIDALPTTLEAPIRYVFLDPQARGYPRALNAIADADLIVIGPGDLFTSLVPNLLVLGVDEAIAESEAPVLLVSNLMTKRTETPGFRVDDLARAVAMYLRPAALDLVLYNSSWDGLDLARYASEGSEPIRPRGGDVAAERWGGEMVGAELLAGGTLARHDPRRLAAALASLARRHGWW